jgi:hypothetical protein
VIAVLNQTKAEVAKWSTAVGSRSTLTGVRGFESLPPHHNVIVRFLRAIGSRARLARLSSRSAKLIARGVRLQVAVSLVNEVYLLY